MDTNHHSPKLATRWMIYGANGYTGRLVAEAAVAMGDAPILAGRDREAITALATPLGLEARVFSLDDPSGADLSLPDVDVVVNVAGPFSATAAPLFHQCCATGTSYMDVSGEVEVLEQLLTLDDQAKAAGIAAVVGIGYAHSDALLAATAALVNDPVEAVIALDGFDRYSPGTMRTVFEDLVNGGRVLHHGHLTRAREMSLRRRVPFPAGTRRCASITWGDLALVGRSTGVRDAVAYATVPAALAAASPALPALARLAATKPGKRLTDCIARTSAGPTAEQRAAEPMDYWAEIIGGDGSRAVGTMSAPNIYSVTIDVILAAVHRISGVPTPGASTPSAAFGPAFGLGLPGITHTLNRVTEENPRG